MKTVGKLLASCLLLMSLSACGDTEEEIVYEESPLAIPAEYILGENDTAPSFYTDVFTFTAENIAPPIVATEVPEGHELTKDEENYLKEEEERLTAERDLLDAELQKENNKLNSLRLVSMQDPTEANNAALAEATEEHEAWKESQKETVSIIPEDGSQVEYSLSTEGEGTPTATSQEEEVEDLSYLEAVEQAAYVYTYDVSTTGNSGGQATAGYATLLSGSGFKIVDPFHPVNNEYYAMLTPDFTQRAGTVAFAKTASGTERLMMIIVDWHYYGATVTVEYVPGTLWIPPKVDKVTKTSLSISDAVGFLQSRNPSDLGLSGTSMESYNIYTAEGLVMINGDAYREFVISGKATEGNGNTYGGTYLINADGDTFSVDSIHGTVVPLNIVNVFDTLN